MVGQYNMNYQCNIRMYIHLKMICLETDLHVRDLVTSSWNLHYDLIGQLYPHLKEDGIYIVHIIILGSALWPQLILLRVPQPQSLISRNGDIRRHAPTGIGGA